MSRSTGKDDDKVPHPDDWGPRTFTKLGFSTYRLALDRGGIALDLSQLRRDRHELIGELRVLCEFAGARTVKGVLHIADFNLSSAQARSTRAKILSERALTKDVDWEGLLQELCQSTLDAERHGDPAMLIDDAPVVEHVPDFDVHGLSIPRIYPSILFGDGGSAKSLLALEIASHLAQQGEIVMYCDWEADVTEHAKRLRMLCPETRPALLYVRCERPLVQEVDRIRRLCVEQGVTYTIMDSAAYGCEGAPEAAESCLDYFRAIRSLGRMGHFIIAHMTKSDDGDKRPFGSSFWHNSARATWHIKRSNPDDYNDLTTLVSQRKSNFGRARSPLTLDIEFGDTISIRRSSILDRPEFSHSIDFGQRLFATLRSGPMSREQIRKAFPDDKPENIRQTISRALKGNRLLKFDRGGEEFIQLQAVTGVT